MACSWFFIFSPEFFFCTLAHTFKYVGQLQIIPNFKAVCFIDVAHTGLHVPLRTNVWSNSMSKMYLGPLNAQMSTTPL